MAFWGVIPVLARASPNRAQRGLYGGAKIQYGNNVSFSNRKTRRKWLPNVQRKELYSQALEAKVPVRLTTSVLREIDRRGGLDNYLLYTREDRVDSVFGSFLKKRIVTALEAKTGQPVIAKPVPLRYVPKTV